MSFAVSRERLRAASHLYVASASLRVVLGLPRSLSPFAEISSKLIGALLSLFASNSRLTQAVLSGGFLTPSVLPRGRVEQGKTQLSLTIIFFTCFKDPKEPFEPSAPQLPSFN